jgi:hypothetical protein
MIEVTEEEIAARELRSAAYHEAGHKVLYEHFGGAGDAIVWRNDSGNPEERAWFGQFRTRVCPEQMRNVALRYGLPARELPANWRVLVGMAGLLAEAILNCGPDDIHALADDIHYRISTDEASASDLVSMGISDIDDFELSFEVVGFGARLLREAWRNVQEEAQYLIELAETESAHA